MIEGLIGVKASDFRFPPIADIRGERHSSHMDEDEIAAFHEAAHAVFAAFSPWTRICGPVTLDHDGAGDITMATDVEAITKTVRSNPRFDRDLPRLHLIRSLLAGPVAERILVELGRARVSEAVLTEASRARPSAGQRSCPHRGQPRRL